MLNFKIVVVVDGEEKTITPAHLEADAGSERAWMHEDSLALDVVDSVIRHMLDIPYEPVPPPPPMHGPFRSVRFPDTMLPPDKE